MSDGKIIIDTSIDSSGAEKDIKSLTSKLGGIAGTAAKTLAKVSAVMVTATAGAIGVLTKLSVEQYAEYEHFERILEDAICTSPLEYDLPSLSDSPSPLRKKYQKYQKESYHPEPHYQKDKGDSPHEKA